MIDQKHEWTAEEAMQQALESLKNAPLVRLADGYYEFFLDGEKVYDFQAKDAGHALRWVEHMAQKSWVTTAHLEQFARLAAANYGAAY